MPISKDAHGLPRYMMDCGWWRNGRKWRRRTLAEMGLMTAMVSFANEHGTDGVLPGDVEELAQALSLPLKEVRATLPKLKDRGAIRTLKPEEDDSDIEIVDFLEHNPSRAEVDADRRRKAAASARGNHQRWHVEKGVADPDCEYCTDTTASSDQDSESDTRGSPNGNPGQSPYVSKEGSMDGRKEGTSSSSLVSEEPLGTPPADDDGPPSWAHLEAERQANEPRRPGVEPIHDRTAWVLEAERRAWSQHGAMVAQWRIDESGLTDFDIACRLAQKARTESLLERARRLAAEDTA